MRKLWSSSLALSLGLLGQSVHAEGETWRVVQPVSFAQPAPAAAPAVSLGRPVAELDRPVALPNDSALDSEIRPTTFRAAAPDQVIARPMPIGPAEAKPSLHAWGRAAEVAPPEAANEYAPAPKIVPTPVGEPMHGGPVMGGPVMGAAPWSVMGNGSINCGSSTCCIDPCCDPCGAGGMCGGNRFYVGAEYLLWWLKASPTPPLATTGPAVFPPGVLGNPGTQVLFGDDMGSQAQSGGRLYFGWWLFGDQCLGLDFGGFYVGGRGDGFSATSFGNPVLARPFVELGDPASPFETTQITAFPGLLAGSINVTHNIDLWSAEANLRSNICCGCNFRLDALAGFRTLGLDEELTINETVLSYNPLLNPPLGNPNTFNLQDSFRTENRFYGAQVGAIAEWRLGRWVLDLKSKVAFGTTQQLVNISGNTTTTDLITGATTNAPGGLLALTSNIGQYRNSRFSVVPEVGFNVGYMFTDRLRGSIGYNFLYWNHVARPGSQIDRGINSNLLPGGPGGGPNRPAFLFRDSDFWAQGVSLGLEYRW